MATVNTKAKGTATIPPRLAGGYGVTAAKQSPEAQLRRVVMANLLWEDTAYQSGSAIAEEIRALVAKVKPDVVAALAREARNEQKLRHVPLFLAREMARLATHKHLVGKLLPDLMHRPDDITEFLAMYWQDKRQPLSKQVKVGLAAAYRRFDAYQLAKYKQDDQTIKLRDPLFLVHAKPKDEEQRALWKQLVEKKLAPADTWEVELSASQDKCASWERLLRERRLGALAFLRNLRNMEAAGVGKDFIREAFAQISPGWLLPMHFVTAAVHAPTWKPEIEALMLRSLQQLPKLAGTSIFVVDVSGSMQQPVSGKSDQTRLDAGAAMVVLAREVCEDVHLYATAGSDGMRRHRTEALPDLHGFALAEAVSAAQHRLGGGGIFTRQCLDWIHEREQATPERIMIFSDSQDCDVPGSGMPEPFGKRNYIIDVSAHTHGINYAGVWTAEVSGFSEYFLRFIAALEQAEANAA